MINKHVVLKGILFYDVDEELAADAAVQVVLDALDSAGLLNEVNSREGLISACKTLLHGLLCKDTTMVYRNKLDLNLAKYFLITMLGYDMGSEYFEKYVFKMDEAYPGEFKVIYLENARQFNLIEV